MFVSNLMSHRAVQCICYFDVTWGDKIVIRTMQKDHSTGVPTTPRIRHRRRSSEVSGLYILHHMCVGFPFGNEVVTLT